jgi:NAD(P)-dependent dehydrogenase (short-subunit alcohol dehydrogenase family)
MESFNDKVILITGGSSGLGAATTLRFARDGAKVAIGARRTEQSEAVVRQIDSLRGQGLFIRTDVRRRADVEALAAGTVARFGRLDCVVNNAGITVPGTGRFPYDLPRCLGALERQLVSPR